MIDYYAICQTHELRGPPVWRGGDPDEMRRFLTEHSTCVVEIHAEHHPSFDYSRYEPKGG
jgi:hypothetical protein